MFINSDHKILAQKQIIEALRLEIIKLTTERDNLILGNSELVRAKTENHNMKVSASQELITIESILEDTRRNLEIQSHHFATLTDKQRGKIRELSQDISRKLEEISIYESKELIDIDNENRKRKSEISRKNKELQSTIDELARTRKELEDHKDTMKREREELQEYREKLYADKLKLKNKERQLKLYEIRLTELKKEIGVARTNQI